MSSTEIPYGFIKGNQIFLKGWNDRSDRLIGEIKDDNPEKSVEYFENRFKDFSDKVDTILSNITNSENKGSFQMQLKHLIEKIETHDGLGDYESLQKKIVLQLNEIQDLIIKNRNKNTEIKKALLQEASEASKLLVWKESFEKLKDIKERWIKTGPALAEEDSILESEFRTIYDEYFERRNAFQEDRRKLSAHYEETYKRLVVEANHLSDLSEESAVKKENELREQWKENGPVSSEIYKRLLGDFNRNIRKRKFKPKVNIDDLREKLQKELDKASFKSELNFKELFASLKEYNAKSQAEREKKSNTYELLFMVQEIDFVYRQSERSKKGFQDLPLSEQKKQMKKLVLELLERDKSELNLIENSPFSSRNDNQGFQKIINSKLTRQKQKINLKERILRELLS